MSYFSKLESASIKVGTTIKEREGESYDGE
jgi:hypothetical protein